MAFNVNFRRRALQLLGALCCMVAAGAIAAQAPKAPYKPSHGQAGKDVVWIPSPPQVVELMLDIARVTPQDYVVDLGSGDGRNVIAAARRGARGLGVEYNPDLVEFSRRAAVTAGVGDKATFVEADMFKADVSQATVLVLFLVPDNLSRLAPKFLDLKPGTRIVSNTFEIGGGWEPDETTNVAECLKWCGIHLYTVPAKVDGTWRLPQGELRLGQEFQNVSGTLETSGISRPIENVLLRGDAIHFTVGAVHYSGRVSGDSMAGSAQGRTTETWSAHRSRE